MCLYKVQVFKIIDGSFVISPSEKWTVEKGDYQRPYEETKTFAVKERRKKLLKKVFLSITGFIILIIIYILVNYYLFDSKGLPFNIDLT